MRSSAPLTQRCRRFVVTWRGRQRYMLGIASGSEFFKSPSRPTDGCQNTKGTWVARNPGRMEKAAEGQHLQACGGVSHRSRVPAGILIRGPASRPGRFPRARPGGRVAERAQGQVLGAALGGLVLRPAGFLLGGRVPCCCWAGLEGMGMPPKFHSSPKLQRRPCPAPKSRMIT